MSACFGTYKHPCAKINVTASFSDLLSVILNTCGIGRDNIIKLAKTDDTAFAYHRAIRLIQCPGRLGCHSFSMGVHVQMKLQVLIILQMTTKTPTATR